MESPQNQSAFVLVHPIQLQQWIHQRDLRNKLERDYMNALRDLNTQSMEMTWQGILESPAIGHLPYRKVVAILFYRETTHKSLLEAKAAIEEYIAEEGLSE